MASSKEFVEYVAERLAKAGRITYRKMFGEYGIYCDGKFFACICDDQFFVKVTESGEKVIKDIETAPPYEGAKPYFLLANLDDSELLCNLTVATCRALPDPQPKKQKKES